MVLNHDCEKWRLLSTLLCMFFTRLLRGGEVHCLNIKRNFSYFSVSPGFLGKNPDKLVLSKVTTKVQMGAGLFLLYWSFISQLFLLVYWLRGFVFCFVFLSFFWSPPGFLCLTVLFPISSTGSRDVLPLSTWRPRTVIKQAVAHSTGVRFCVREGVAAGAHQDSQVDLLLTGKWHSLVQESQMQYSCLSNQKA